jgi:zinc protease
MKASKTHMAVPGVTFVQSLGGITEYTLKSNGLRILLVPDNSVPVAGCMVTYHVGSRNEATGYTGATHLLEHLLFKGSKKFNKKNKNSVDILLEKHGALLNATTWFDRTNYYEIVPEDALSLAIEIEADRMRTALFSKQDKEDEMPIVRNEFERGENLPMEALDKAVWQAAYVAHPYHHSTIGWRSDIENVSIERLRKFYDDFYHPDNATVTIAGSFDEKKVLNQIKKFFGAHPRSPKEYPKVYTTEPTQEGERRAVVHRSGVDMICVAHKTPEALHADIPALLILGTILHDDKTSRLHKAFIDSAKGTDVQLMCFQLLDPGLFQTFITLSPKTTHLEAELLLKKEYDHISKKGITEKELAKAKRSIRVSLAARKDGLYSFLMTINEDLASGDWTRFVTLPKLLEKVSTSDVQRVAQIYLKESQSTVGYFVNSSK